LYHSWITGFQNSVGNQKVEVAANSGWSQGKTLAESAGCRRAILENRTRDGIAGANVLASMVFDFHNINVS
jgi:hypothetical protein